MASSDGGRGGSMRVWRFSLRLRTLEERGMGEKPFCRAHRRTTWGREGEGEGERGCKEVGEMEMMMMMIMMMIMRRMMMWRDS